MNQEEPNKNEQAEIEQTTLEQAKIDQLLEDALEGIEAARSHRAENIEEAHANKDLAAVAELVANEVAAEKELEKTMQFFADQASHWTSRRSAAKKKSALADVENCSSIIQAYIAAKNKCLESLQESETHQALLIYLELKVSQATKAEIEGHLEDWSRRAEAARKSRNSDLEDYALESKRICQKALDALEK
ncbi:hypothetical protein KBI23_11680 [bacterium]|nr:hypothetical protein [bacterium]MBP9806872.1 hypothetical protein [bacterium]